MPESLKIAGAGVQTVTVTLKALHVGNKQMTLSVFRQLVNEPIWDPRSRTLRGEPWGFINYFWQGCGMDAPHLHVLWQKGDELRRTCISERLGESEHRDFVANLDKILLRIGEVGILFAALIGIKPTAEERQDAGFLTMTRTYLTVRQWARRMEYPERPMTGYVPDVRHDIDAVFHRAEEAVGQEAARDRLSRLHGDLAGAIESSSENIEAGSMRSADLDELVQIETRVAEEKRSYEAAWDETYLRVRALDQLFVAV